MAKSKKPKLVTCRNKRKDINKSFFLHVMCDAVGSWKINFRPQKIAEALDIEYALKEQINMSPKDIW